MACGGNLQVIPELRAGACFYGSSLLSAALCRAIARLWHTAALMRGKQ